MHETIGICYYVVLYLRRGPGNERSYCTESLFTFSFQHELGIYLREKYPNYRVRFDRNVSFFHSRANAIKKEMDIVVPQRGEI